MIFAPYIIIIMHTAMQYRKTVICLLAAFCLPLCIRGQKNDDENILNRYIMITRMVTDGQFTAAEKELEELIPLLNPENGLKRINAESLLLECRIRNARPDIDGLVYAFMTEYPQCERQEELMLLYAGHYFDRKNYEKASEILEGINTEELSPPHEDRKERRSPAGIRRHNLGTIYRLHCPFHLLFGIYPLHKQKVRTMHSPARTHNRERHLRKTCKILPARSQFHA